MSAATMTTSDGPPPTTPGGGAVDAAMAMEQAIQRLANEFFSVAGISVPPNPGPNALGLGAGGASPLVTLPPVPGPLKQPPLVNAPPPKEADFRAMPTQLSEQLGSPSPIALASSLTASASTPYFLELAGLPTPGSVPPGAGLAPATETPWSSGLSQAQPASPTQSSESLISSGPADPATPTYDFRPELVPDLGTTAR